MLLIIFNTDVLAINCDDKNYNPMLIWRGGENYIWLKIHILVETNYEMFFVNFKFYFKWLIIKH